MKSDRNMPTARPPEVDSLGVINLIGSNLIDKYSPRSILKELLQNADDAGAGKVVVGWTPGPGGNAAHQLLHGPALFVVNDGKFTANDAQAICRFGQNYKFGERAVIGARSLVSVSKVSFTCARLFSTCPRYRWTDRTTTGFSTILQARGLTPSTTAIGTM